MAVRGILVVALGLALCAQSAGAEDYDGCVSKAEQIFNGCVSQAEKLVNDVEIQDARAVCDSSFATSRSVCDDAEANRGGRGADPDAPQEEAGK